MLRLSLIIGVLLLAATLPAGACDYCIYDSIRPSPTYQVNPAVDLIQPLLASCVFILGLTTAVRTYYYSGLAKTPRLGAVLTLLVLAAAGSTYYLIGLPEFQEKAHMALFGLSSPANWINGFASLWVFLFVFGLGATSLLKRPRSERAAIDYIWLTGTSLAVSYMIGFLFNQGLPMLGSYVRFLFYRY